MTITLRVEKGAPLTIAELDGNFTDLDGRLIVVEDGQTSIKSIDEIVQVGNSLVVQYTDSSEDGPFTFEVGITYRGDWEPSTVYAQNDMVKANGVIYIVLLAHTSDTVFDPGASAGTAGDYYAPFLEMPELTIPDGGDTGTVLTKVSATDYDYQWAFAGVPVGGLIGEALVKASSDNYDVEWVNIGAIGVSPIVEISTATLTVDNDVYASGYMRCTHASGCDVTILPDDEFEFETATELHFRQCSVNSVAILAGSSTAATVTLNAPTGYETVTAVEGAVITVKKVTANEWDVFGLLAAST
jgi:hypothetical protein